MAQFVSRQDLDFLLDDWLGTSVLTQRARFGEHSAETFGDVLDLIERLAVEKYASHNRAADLHEPRVRSDGTVELLPQVEAAITAYVNSGLYSAPFPHEVGGADLPMSVRTALNVWLAATNSSTAGYSSLSAAAANLLIAHASPDLIDRYARPLVEGRFFGTMCLSETQAGSSLADITTRAERQPDGTYRLRGQKMWISAGDHELGENIIHLVLARTGDPRLGAKSISLFAVPKLLVGDDGRLGERNDVSLIGLNHKMGNRGTVNTALAFGSGEHWPAGRAGAIGHLVGEPDRGLFHMFRMMNEMRIAVGASAVGLGSAGYLSALDYARRRTQGRARGGTEPVPIIQHADVRGMLLTQKSYTEGALALVLYCGRLFDDQETAETDEERRDAAELLDLLTPIAKSFPSQWCLAANDLAIQVHGGYGYTRDFPVEQHYRDNRLNAIHEGTHGIQALDLLGRKVRLADGRGLRLLTRRMARTVEEAKRRGGEVASLGEQLAERVKTLTRTTDTLWSTPDLAATLANASLYLEAFGHVVVAWLWLEQHLASGDRRTGFHRGKRAAAHFFYEHELPKVDHQFALLASLSRTTLDVDPDWL